MEILERLFGDSQLDLAELWSEAEGPRVETRWGQSLFDVHDPVTEAFLIVEGRVILFSGEGTPRPLLRMKGPALCGDVELLLGRETHNHSARCLERCRVVIVTREQLTSLARSLVSNAWYRDIAMRYHRTMGTAVYEGLSIEVRLGRWLVDTFADAWFTMPSDKEIGHHLCVSADRIGRARRAIEKTGVLLLEDERVRVELNELEEVPLDSSIIHSLAER